MSSAANSSSPETQLKLTPLSLTDQNSSFRQFCLFLRDLLRRCIFSSTLQTLKYNSYFLKIHESATPQLTDSSLHHIQRSRDLQNIVKDALSCMRTQLLLLKISHDGFCTFKETSVFNKLKTRVSPSVELALVKMLFEKRDFGHLLQFATYDSDMLPETISIVARACCQTRSHSMADSLLENAIESKLTHTTSNELYEAILACIHCYFKANKPEKSERPWEILKRSFKVEENPISDAHYTMLKGWSQTLRRDKALLFYKKATSARNPAHLFTKKTGTMRAFFECLLSECTTSQELETTVSYYFKTHFTTLDISVYGIGVRHALRLKEFKLGLRIFQELVNRIQHDTDLVVHNSEHKCEYVMGKVEIAFNMLIDHFAKRKYIHETKAIFEGVETIVSKTKLYPLKVVVYNSMLDAYVRTNNLKSAFMFLDTKILNNPDIQYDNFTITTLTRGVKHTSEAHYLDKIFTLLDSATFPLEIVVFNVLIEACINSQQIQRAFKLFRSMDYQHFSRELYASDYAQDSLGLFKNTKPQYQVRPDVVTFNTIIKACCQIHNIDSALNYLLVLKLSENMKPNDVTFNTIIDGCTRSRNRMDLAWRILEDMYRCGVAPDSFTFSTLVKGIKKNSQRDSKASLERALHFLETVTKQGMAQADQVLYNCIMDTCLYFRKLDKAVNLFHEMQERGVKPSSVTYGILIKGYGQFKRLNTALQMYREMKHQNLKPNQVTYGCLIDACVNNHELDKALSIFEEMKHSGSTPNTIIYTTLVKGFSRRKDLKAAMNLYTTMKRDMQHNDCAPNNITYNSLLDCCVRCNDLALANQLWNQMQEMAGLMPDLISYSTLIKGYCMEGKITQAFQLLDVMIEKDKIMPDEVLFNSLLDGCVRANAFKIGELVFKKMQTSHIELSVVAYSIMIKMYGKTGQIEKAFQMLREIKTNNLQPGLIVFTCIIKGCLQSKNTNKALQAFEMLKEETMPDKVVYQTLIQGLLNRQNYETLAAEYALEAWNDYGIMVVQDLQIQLLEKLQFLNPYPAQLIEQIQTITTTKSQRKHKPKQRESVTTQLPYQPRKDWKQSRKPKYVMKHQQHQHQQSRDIADLENYVPCGHTLIKEEKKEISHNILTPITNIDTHQNHPHYKNTSKPRTQQNYDEKENRHVGAQKKVPRKAAPYRENYDLRRF